MILGKSNLTFFSIKNYQNLVLKEKEDPKTKMLKVKDRKSFLAFGKIHPNENLDIYNELCDLIIADTEFNEN